jgi:hypothetical protein
VQRSNSPAVTVRSRADPELEHDHPVALGLQHHVRGLDVPMHQAPRVRRRQRGGDLAHDAFDARDRDLGASRARRLQRLPLDVLHDEVAGPGARQLADLENTHDVGVCDRGRGLRFAREPPTRSLVGREGGGEHLHHHVALEGRIAGEEDRAHPALAELPEERQARGQDLAQFGSQRRGFAGLGRRRLAHRPPISLRTRVLPVMSRPNMQTARRTTRPNSEVSCRCSGRHLTPH